MVTYRRYRHVARGSAWWTTRGSRRLASSDLCACEVYLGMWLRPHWGSWSDAPTASQVYSSLIVLS